MKNFILISPHFPSSYFQFAKALRNNGFRVLGIGDAPLHELSNEIINSMDEYYVCHNMENINNLINAVKYYEYKYGPISYLESNNEYWLRSDAKLREIFNINGIKGDEISEFNHKSKMKKYYKMAKIKTAKYILVENKEQVLKFIDEVGLPIFIKPDLGVGASGDFKIESLSDLDEFFIKKDNNVTYICEQYITGDIISYDGISNSRGEVIFQSSSIFPPSVSDVLKRNDDFFYYVLPKVPKDLEEIGRRAVSSFNIKNRYFHFEFFRLTKNIKGVGKINDIVGLEVNIRPPGGFTPDLINFANSVNSYQIYADSMMYDFTKEYMHHEKYYAACASRRDNKEYLYSDEEIISRFHGHICHFGRYPDVFSGIMGNRFFMAKFKSKSEVNNFYKIVSK